MGCIQLFKYLEVFIIALKTECGLLLLLSKNLKIILKQVWAIILWVRNSDKNINRDKYESHPVP